MPYDEILSFHSRRSNRDDMDEGLGHELYIGGYRLLFLVNEHAFVWRDVLTRDAMRKVRYFEKDFTCATRKTGLLDTLV